MKLIRTSELKLVISHGISVSELERMKKRYARSHNTRQRLKNLINLDEFITKHKDNECNR